MPSKIVFERTYNGFEDAVDLERDISEMFDYSPAKEEIPGEFQGNLKVLIWYEPTPQEIFIRGNNG